MASAPRLSSPAPHPLSDEFSEFVEAVSPHGNCHGRDSAEGSSARAAVPAKDLASMILTEIHIVMILITRCLVSMM